MLRRFVKKIDRKGIEKQNGQAHGDGGSVENGAGSERMAAKKQAAAAAGGTKAPEQIAFQIEVETEQQWRALCRREGLIVVDVFAGWAGPCTSMISILKRVKVEVNDDRLWLAVANSDKIGDLLMFKDQSEPTWLFIAGGKPVKVIRSANVPKLVNTIKAEFEHELHCMQGKARRNLISIDDEVTRRKKAEDEAIRLSKLVRDEDEAADELNAIRKESSVRLMNTMEPYTVLVVQNFLLETGAVTEIRDSLQGEFKIEQERLVPLNEAGIRQLFRIPYKIPDPVVVEDFGYVEPEGGEEDPDKDPGEGEEGTEGPPPDGPIGEEDGPSQPLDDTPKKKKRKMIEVKLPEGLVGETLFMLLESLDIRKMMKSGNRPMRDSLLQTADDYLLIKIGPIQHKDAVEHAPYSMHALYGKGQYAPGVWCPRRYDDKRHVMINFFPRFVTDLLMPSPTGTPKYMVAVFPTDMTSSVNKEIDSFKADVYDQGKMKMPPNMADEMLKSWSKNSGSDDFKAKKKAMSGDVFALSVNRKNSALVLALQALDPLHMSYDAGYGKQESGKLFKKLNITLDGQPNPDQVVEKFLARSRPRIVSLTELNAEDLPRSKRASLKSNDGESDSSPPQTGASTSEPEPSMAKPIPPPAPKKSVDKSGPEAKPDSPPDQSGNETVTEAGTTEEETEVSSAPNPPETTDTDEAPTTDLD